jgi:uncharacterized protein YceH (UPF0502 family)
MKRDEPLVAKLERQAGQKEARFAHLLCWEASIQQTTTPKPAAVAPAPADRDRVGTLEEEVAALRSDVETLKQAFSEFRKQFE